MPEDLFCSGQKIVSTSYRDGYDRAFIGYPKMSKATMGLLNRYLENKEYSKIMMFFTSICEYDVEYAGFLLRELIRGNI